MPSDTQPASPTRVTHAPMYSWPSSVQPSSWLTTVSASIAISKSGSRSRSAALSLVSASLAAFSLPSSEWYTSRTAASVS